MTDLDTRIQRDDEFSDSEDEGTGGRKDNKSHKKSSTKSNSKASKSATPAPLSAADLLATTSATLSSLTPAPAPTLPAPTAEQVSSAPTDAEIDAMEAELFKDVPTEDLAKAGRAQTSAARATTEAGVGEDDGVVSTIVSAGEDTVMGEASASAPVLP